MEVITGVWEFLGGSYISNPQDERTKDWILVKDVWVVYVITGVWLYFVKSLGPKYMKNRKPYDLKNFIYYYNVFQIICNGWSIYAAIANGLFTDIGLGCKMVDPSPTGKPMALATIIFWVTLLKIIDLVETIIFVLRKKDRQISFLHLYHHISTVYLSLMTLKFFPGGMATVALAVNSTVHVIMYTYYLISSQGPRAQRLVAGFKPFITIMQMAQFFFLLGHTAQGFLPSCAAPKWGLLLFFLNLIINFVLFYNFYRKNYIQKQKET